MPDANGNATREESLSVERRAIWAFSMIKSRRDTTSFYDLDEEEQIRWRALIRTLDGYVENGLWAPPRV